jgi:hypothetical protein
VTTRLVGEEPHAASAEIRPFTSASRLSIVTSYRISPVAIRIDSSSNGSKSIRPGIATAARASSTVAAQ